MRDISVHPLPTSEVISLVRFDGSLYFANASYFEDKILEEVASKPKLRYIIVDASAINQLDATGEEVLHHLAERLNANDIEIVFAGMKKQFMDVIRRTRLIEFMREDHFFARTQNALDYVWDSLGEEYDRTTCPLRMQKSSS
jgi:SulP family sulfate permease